MSPQSREKIALAVFAALIVLSLCGLGWYLLAGHSWNVAASNIDDTFGSMDGYTAIVYAGTAEVLEVPDEDASAGGSGYVNPQIDPLEKDADPADSADSGASDQPKTETDASAGAGSQALASATASGASAAASSKKDPITVDDAHKSYEEKGAVVFTLDTMKPTRYAEGTILKKGNHRFGVFSVDRPLSVRAVEKQVAYFTKHQVDFIVAVTPDKAFVEKAEGIDIVVSTQDEELFVMGETVDGTFYVDSPVVGKVGAILISPSNVVSAKVIEEL